MINLRNKTSNQNLITNYYLLITNNGIAMMAMLSFIAIGIALITYAIRMVDFAFVANLNKSLTNIRDRALALLIATLKGCPTTFPLKMNHLKYLLTICLIYYHLY